MTYINSNSSLVLYGLLKMRLDFFENIQSCGEIDNCHGRESAKLEYVYEKIAFDKPCQHFFLISHS